ncbi:hypothetical protein NPIL_472571 [Nephila pilipes]|uniref:Uncharacterized protein n=1 Tax=Nephila pilipes TaxID=299642 RepID=A0A8X6PYA0_NEPPI|nr:hypothetical protein NPIL_472571 [Nephila pilipes]
MQITVIPQGTTPFPCTFPTEQIQLYRSEPVNASQSSRFCPKLTGGLGHQLQTGSVNKSYHHFLNSPQITTKCIHMKVTFICPRTISLQDITLSFTKATRSSRMIH